MLRALQGLRGLRGPKLRHWLVIWKLWTINSHEVLTWHCVNRQIVFEMTKSLNNLPGCTEYIDNIYSTVKWGNFAIPSNFATLVYCSLLHSCMPNKAILDYQKGWVEVMSYQIVLKGYPGYNCCHENTQNGPYFRTKPTHTHAYQDKSIKKTT